MVFFLRNLTRRSRWQLTELQFGVSPQSFLQIKPGSLSLYFFPANPRALIMISSQICWYKVGKKHKVSAKVKKLNSRRYLLDWAKLLIVTPPLPKQDPSKWSVGLLSYELFIFRGKGELEDRGGPGIIFSSRPECSFFSSSFFPVNFSAWTPPQFPIFAALILY